MGQVSNETLCSMPSFSRMYSLSWRLWGPLPPAPAVWHEDETSRGLDPDGEMVRRRHRRHRT